MCAIESRMMFQLFSLLSYMLVPQGRNQMIFLFHRNEGNQGKARSLEVVVHSSPKVVMCARELVSRCLEVLSAKVAVDRSTPGIHIKLFQPRLSCIDDFDCRATISQAHPVYSILLGNKKGCEEPDRAYIHWPPPSKWCLRPVIL